MRFVSTSALRGGALPAFGGAHRTHKRDYAEERGDWFIVLGETPERCGHPTLVRNT